MRSIYGMPDAPANPCGLDAGGPFREGAVRRIVAALESHADKNTLTKWAAEALIVIGFVVAWFGRGAV